MVKKLGILSLIGIALLFAACGPIDFSLRVIEGNGQIVSEARDVSGFDAVVLNGYGTLNVVQGDEEGLTITTDENLMEHITSEVQDGTLVIGLKENTIVLEPSNDLIFDVSVIDLSRLEVNGAGSVEAESLTASQFNLNLDGAGGMRIRGIEADTLNVTVNGAGSIEIEDAAAGNLDIRVNGGGSVRLDGEATSQTLDINGLGTYKAGGLESQTADVTINGGGSVTIWVLEALDVTVNGAGSVNYYGSPEVTQDIDGAGSIEGLGEK